ncbi:MAG TPA: cell division protein FtsQ/DivIB [Burkholderiaceae bacterium]|nr:cell division protein FtsQ/DivIB [Burkholderiaceae bacterium]
MARTVSPAMPALPFDVRLAQVGANALLTLLALALLAGATWWLARLPAFTLRGIGVDGDLAHNSPLTMRAIVMPRLAGSFLSLDLARARDAFESVPWVRRATVRRVWPDRLAVTLEEHRVAALWNPDTGDEGLVNTFGEVFEANLGDVEDDGLPNLAGPAGSAARVLAMYRTLAPVMQPLGSPIETLLLTGHGSWRATLGNGVVIELGRGELDAVAARAARFVRTVPQVTATYQRPLLAADLRHADGYAVRLKGVTTTASTSTTAANGSRH